jgi:hypothetical protein
LGPAVVPNKRDYGAASMQKGEGGMGNKKEMGDEKMNTRLPCIVQWVGVNMDNVTLFAGGLKVAVKFKICYL